MGLTHLHHACLNMPNFVMLVKFLLTCAISVCGIGALCCSGDAFSCQVSVGISTDPIICRQVLLWLLCPLH